MAGLFDDCLYKSSNCILVEYIQSLCLYLVVSQFFECVLMVSGYKYRSASFSKCRSDSAAYGTRSVHNCRFIFEDSFHLDDSFRSRWATTKFQAFVANAFG